MNENIQDSGAKALWKYETPEIEILKKKSLEKKIEKGKIKLFLDADLKPCLTSTYKHHIHPNLKVPWRVLKLWKKRGFKPLTRGVAHVRFENSDIKYVFPAYFHNKNKKVEPSQVIS